MSGFIEAGPSSSAEVERRFSSFAIQTRLWKSSFGMARREWGLCALIIAIFPLGSTGFLGPLPHGGRVHGVYMPRPGLCAVRPLRILAPRCCSFRTEINVPQSSKSISVGDSVTLLGSCFSDNIAAKLRDAKFKVDANPFGISFHPKSIAFCLERMASGAPFREEDLRIGNDGQWFSFQHHTCFSVRSLPTPLSALSPPPPAEQCISMRFT